MLNKQIHDCSLISRLRNEPMMGSVKPVKNWLLLEYQAAMGAQALAESDIPTEVQKHLNEVIASGPKARLLLIKSQQDIPEKTIKLIAVNSREADPFYIQHELESYERLLDIPLDVPISDSYGGDLVIQRSPFFLVCTNGRRDPCCARNGLPVFNTLNELAPAKVWQSSHMGGHRFAANVLQFPQGICYGRMTPNDAENLLRAGGEGELLLDHYRGRACYEKYVQAAEAHLRLKTGKMGFEELGEDHWRVKFIADNDTKHILDLELVKSDTLDYVSCRDDKQSPIVSYRLLDYSVG
jgi:hypothetical protein